MRRLLSLRAIWISVSSLVVAAALSAGGSSAEAHDPCGCAPRGCRPAARVVSRGCGCNTGYRSRSRRGGSWSQLRRGLGQGSFYDPTRRWVRDHYLTRFPFAHVTGQEAENIRVLLSDDLLAVMSEDQGKAAVLDTDTQLDRAAARFFDADYDGAKEDLKAVLTARPDEPRAHWGLFLTAICKSEWADAKVEMKVLAEAGEFKAGDRIDSERVFADAKVFPSLVKGLRIYADMRISDGAAQLVTAWALSAQGETTTAKRYLGLARRWGADSVTTAALGKALAAPAKAKPAAAEPKKQGQVTPKTDGGVRAPDPAELHRQMAAATKKATLVAQR